MQWASSTRHNADITRNCPSVRRMAAKSARLRCCSSSKMGQHRLVVAPGIRTHFATTICNDHLLQATSVSAAETATRMLTQRAMPMLISVTSTVWAPLALSITVAVLLGAVQGCDRQRDEYEEVAVGTLIPEIVGDWWQIAGNPDLGEFTSPEQEPTAFGMWQAADGTWQLWSCIRHTNVWR